MSEDVLRLFVYGSLRRGFRYHDHLRDALHVGVDRTQPAFTLKSLGAYPALVTDGSTSVLGEVFEVSAALLQELDEFEEHPRMYRRTLIELESGRVAHCYLYVADPERWDELPSVVSGDWGDCVDQADGAK